MTFELHHGDCLEVLKTIPDASVDAVITDPPYGLGFPYKSYDDTRANLVHLIDGFMPEALRIARRVVVKQTAFDHRAAGLIQNRPAAVVKCHA